MSSLGRREIRDKSQVAASIKKWLSVCNEHHNTCINASDMQSARPTWLIDVEDLCIVPGDVQARYIALSYTWLDIKGQSSPTDSLQLLSSNIHHMKTPNALRKDASKLPSVIKDAIELTSLLGERWLWVDRLCIVQDGPQKMSECMRMDSIYAGAYMTIAAAVGGGLFGRIWHIPDKAHESTDEKIRRHYWGLKSSKWAKRGWTYQEYILSPRVVFFLDSEIFWQCQIAIWDPMSTLIPLNEQASVSTKPGSILLRKFETPSFPDFSLYADIICPYNGRDLSYQKDGLSACLGILNRLEPAFPGGFIFGLPRIYFDHALLWQPLKASYLDSDSGYSSSELVPRYSSSYTPPISSAFGALSDGCVARRGRSTRRPSLPSWSWCGWQCFVDPKSYRMLSGMSTESDQEAENGSWFLRNLVTWKSVNENGSGKVPSVGLGPLSASNHISARVPSACFLSAATLAIRVYPSHTCHYVGVMRSSINSVLAERPLKDMPAVIVIQDSAGHFSGLLRVTGNQTREEGQEMNLIAISEGNATGLALNGAFEANLLYRSRYYDPQPFYAVYDQDERWVGLSDEKVSGWPHRGEDKYQVLAIGGYKHSFEPPIMGYDHEVTYDFFNVLWVEDGGDGISYRAGCGYVLKDRWEAMAPTETDIILG
ncbi:hypothetical protein NW768_007981 [Fusarium equiseti]|uniref:Heterokaryon incompatibility domain-containing protein n=1 Tax=Fusarium equiseti TaxID=61235 RepID=A0ABQ8R5H6_FUSEQ|nr:hypothetical protein NW768_007981 [Fusarium equiseti]